MSAAALERSERSERSERPERPVAQQALLDELRPAPSGPGRVAFLDTETITLQRGPDVVWEIAVILRDHHAGGPVDAEWCFQLRPNMSKADPRSLAISRFHERFCVPDGVDALGWSPANAGSDEPAVMTHDALAAVLGLLLDGRHVVGTVASFDTERLAAHGGRHAGWIADPWHYHLLNVENLAAGYLAAVARVRAALLAESGWWSEELLASVLGVPDSDRLPAGPPWSSAELSRACGVPQPDEAERHTALGDARWARDLYDAIMAPAPVPA